MESQLHRPHGHTYDDPLQPAELHGEEEEERGGETRSALKKVKEKVDKLKATIKHGHGNHHKDEAQTVNDSPVVRSGLAEPTVMGTPVLAEDLYATHSDIVDPPVRSFAQWEEEERHGAPPPLSTDYETHLTDHHTYGQDVNIEKQLMGGIGKPTGLQEERYGAPPPPIPLSTGYETHIPDAPHHIYGEDVNMGGIGKPTGLEEDSRHGQFTSAGIYGTDLTDLPQVGHHAYGEQDVSMDQSIGTGKSTGMEVDTYPTNTTPANPRSKVTDTANAGNYISTKMKVHDEPEDKSLESDKHVPEVYTGSHDQFAPEPVETPPPDTGTKHPSNQSSSYTQRISSAASAIAHKAAEVKDSLTSKLSSSGENKSEASTVSPRTNKRSSFPTELSHKVADTLSSTLGPVYEKVAGAVQGGGHDETTGSPKVTVREYLVDTFKPGEDDKVLSEVITHAFHRGKGNAPPQEVSTTTYVVKDEVVRDEGERRLQESGN